MKKEEATCEDSGPLTQSSSLVGFVTEGISRDSKIRTCTAPVSSNSGAIEVSVEAGKANDYRLDWLAENVRRSDVSPLARCVLTWLITKRQWRKDRRMIVGKGELAEVFKVHERTIDRCISELLASHCLRLVKQGGSLLGQRREANIYALGSAFDGIPPRFLSKGKDKELPVAEMSPVAKNPPVMKTSPVEKTNSDQGCPCPPLPIVHPKHTNTNNVVLAFSKENWLKRGKDTYPDWDEGNMMGAFHNAEAKRVNGTWPSYQDKCYHLRKSSPKEAPKVASTYKDRGLKAEPSQPHRSQCESPRLPPIDYNNPKILEEQIYTGLKEGLSLKMIEASADPVLYKEAYKRAEARLKGKGVRA